MAFCKELQLEIKVFAWNPLDKKKTCHNEYQSGRNERKLYSITVQTQKQQNENEG